MQVGDYNEKDTNFTYGVNADSAYMLPHIQEFFRYAVRHNNHEANFDSAFITGVSMGASPTLKTALSYPNDFEKIGVTIKGIIPFLSRLFRRGYRI